MNVPFFLWKEIFYLFIINFFISCQNMRKINAKGTSCLFCQARYFFHTSKDVNFTHCFMSYFYFPPSFFNLFHNLLYAFLNCLIAIFFIISVISRMKNNNLCFQKLSNLTALQDSFFCGFSFFFFFSV